MNLKALSSPAVQAWIQKQLFGNVYDLAFKKSPFPGLDMQDLVQQVQGKQIAKKKFPSLFYNDDVLYPPKVNLEQTSSEVTAYYKAKIIKGKNIIDITGGFGIDCLAFSKHFDQVLHIEQNLVLQSLAAHNFKVVEKKNIHSLNTDGVAYLKSNHTNSDILYVDPSRRNPNQHKVFLIEDLTPNILEHLRLWQNQFKQIWIKLSPMIDIHYLIQTIPNISQIHLVAVKNELKEVLVQVSADSLAQIYAVNLETDQPTMVINWNQALQEPSYSEVKNLVYEPNASIQKSGLNDVLAQRYQMNKLHPNSQLFTSNEYYPNFPGRIFEVNQLIKNPKKQLKGKAIQAIHRNFPESLAKLRKKYKFTTDGTEVVIFTQTQNQVLMIDANQIT